MRATIILWALSSCIEFGIDPIDPIGAPVQLFEVTDSFVQAPLPAVDILFVVDDTASMAQEQEALSEAFDAMLHDLDQAGVRWQIGVVTTDMAVESAGMLRGNPWILTPETSDLQAHFSAMIEVGTKGSGDEAGLAAALLALEYAEIGGPNVGFRRGDAGLHVIFVSDSDDNSDAYLDEPVSTFLKVLDGESILGTSAVASSLIGDVPVGCASPMGTALAGFRYAEVTQSTGGAEVSICASDFGPLLQVLGEVSITYQRVYSLSEVPLEDSVRVRIDGEVYTGSYGVDLALRTVTFDVPPTPGAAVEITYLVSNA